MTVESVKHFLSPLHKSVTVRTSPTQTFARFAERFGEWWPRTLGYSVFGPESAACRMETHAGGRIFEVANDGREALWGRVQSWEPPQRMLFTWFPGRAEDASQEIEVRFVPVTEGTRIDLEHRDWHKLGDQAEQRRSEYASGWDEVLGTFGAHASRAGQRALSLGPLRGRVAYFAATIDAPRERVFDLFATADGLDRWFTDGASLDPRAGGQLVFRWRQPARSDEVLEFFGRVRECERPTRFTFDWQADSGSYDLTCAIEFSQTAQGTRVVLNESGFRNNNEGLQDLLNRQSGWAQSIMQLKVFAEHGIRC